MYFDMKMTISAPRVAVLLAAYNGVLFVEDQIKSILSQKDVNVTLFVSVDKSHDGTEMFVDGLAAQDSRIVVLPHGMRFGGAAANFFRLINDVDLSGYDYVSFADQDDIWLSDKLDHACKVISDENAAAYSSNVIAFWPDGRCSLIKKHQPQVRWDFLFEAAGPGCTYVLRQDLILAVKSLQKTHPEDFQRVGLHDWFVYAFARAKGHKWVIDDVAKMFYRQHADNQVGVNSGWKALRYRIRRVSDGWGLCQASLIARLVGLDDSGFVRHWNCQGRLGLLWLALHSRQCRRRGRDKFFFTMACFMVALRGARKKSI